MFEQYKKRILSANDEETLNETVEHAAFCDDLTNAEYCELYSIAVLRYWEIYA